MARRALIPAGMQEGSERLKLSPGIRSGEHIFLTGVTGSSRDGTMPSDLDQQFRQAFDKIDLVLREAGLDCGHIVEMTTYHVGLRDHFDLFCRVRSDYVGEPFPAWTAVEAAGLWREGAVVEIRAVAAVDPV